MKFKPHEHKYEIPVPGSAWTQKVELGAGIYFLDGRTHVAGHSSPMEQELIEAGAMLIATLRFEPDPRERSHPDAPVCALRTGEALRRFRGYAARN